jgi:two-component system, NtrC family, response regulator PilR
MTTPTPRILVVDDDRAVRTAIRVNLSKQGWDVSVAEDAEGALQLIAERPVDLVLTDVAMPGRSGMDLLAALRAGFPEVRVIVMTGYGSVQDAVFAMKSGADDYIIKPVSKDELVLIIQRALKEKALLAELIQLRQEVQEKYGFESIIGTTPAMLEVYELIETVADTTALVLIQGPTGTGKELIAHALHYRSGRRSGAFVRVNCAALPENLLESELFGHEKGSFTGAVRQHRGKFEQADGGTLFLDEIGEISATTQVKLLRALESGEIVRVGGSETVNVSVRVLVATNRDLRAEVAAGRFREDLYYRLNVFTISVPPLQERRDDIPLLVDHFVRRFCKDNNRPLLQVPVAVMQRLINYHWPGNVRELKHVLERAVILSRGETLTAVKLPEAPQGKEPKAEILPEGMTLQAALMEYERRVLIEALKAAKGVQAQAARAVGISRSNLNYRIARLGIEMKDVVYE